MRSEQRDDRVGATGNAAPRRGASPRADDDIAGRTRALVVHGNEFGFDPFGLSRDSSLRRARRRALAVPPLLPRRALGIEHIPPTGRVLFVANHSGQLPFDGLVIGAACFLEPPQPRLVRAMVEYFVPTVPFASYLFSRWGQITGTPENCRRLLDAEEAILVFPEGARGISKPFSQALPARRVRQGLHAARARDQTPIVPVAVIGAEEQAPAINLKPLARLLGTPAFPVVPYPPFVPLAAAAGEVPALLRRADALHRRSRRRRRGARRQGQAGQATGSSR